MYARLFLSSAVYKRAANTSPLGNGDKKVLTIEFIVRYLVTEVGSKSY